MKTRIRASSKGMTIIEVIISVAILGIMTAVLFMVFSSSIFIAIRSGDNTLVTDTASNSVNQIIALNTTNPSITGVNGATKDTINAIVTFKTSAGVPTASPSLSITGYSIGVTTNSALVNLNNITNIKVFVPAQ